MNAVVEKVTEQDMFGHSVCLNFDKRGDTHNTPIGGCFSTTVRIFLCLYVYLLVTKLIYKGNDTDFSYFGVLEMEKLGTVKYDEMDLRVFHAIKKQDKTSTPELDSLASISKYFKITYKQMENDYNTRLFSDTDFGVKECTEEDFGPREGAKELFASWKGYVIICPDLKDSDKIQFEGTPASMISKNLEIMFE